jgi:hypothetical protein
LNNLLHHSITSSFNYSISDWLEKHSLPCFYKAITGMDCPGCGAQRAFIELIRGNIHESLKLYPALIPIFLMVGFMVIHLIFKFENGAKILKILFIFNALIIVFSYIYKLTH